MALANMGSKEAVVTRSESVSANRPLAVAVIGAGPAGLMAAEQLAGAGFQVDLYDAMPSVGRKFLRAGVGGLNLTHSENFEAFISRYTSPALVQPWLTSFGPSQLRRWAATLGIETFTGSSGRVFPVQKKASPMLRLWLQRLGQQGVRIHTRHRWTGWTPEDGGHRLAFEVRAPGQVTSSIIVRARSVVLALGGASWSRLGSDGQWQSMLARAGVDTSPFTPSNCGFDYPWSAFMRERFAGQPLKSVALSLDADSPKWRAGEAMISRHGIQGGLIYHAASTLRQRIETEGFTQIYWDLMPDRTLAAIQDILRQPRGKQSQANFLRKRLAFSGARAAMLHELAPTSVHDPDTLARTMKCLPQRLHSARPLDEAISTGGGIVAAELDDALMLRRMPGVFCAGEMLDWDAPTGGYLLNACLASGRVAGLGASAYLQQSGFGS